MSSENTITIPADLWDEWTTRDLRDYATSLDREHPGGADVFRRLADEIERQAPRSEGWYLVGKQGWTRVYYYTGEEWSWGSEATQSVFVPHDATITPVTIGRAES